MHVEKDIDISRDGYYLKVFGNFGEMILKGWYFIFYEDWNTYPRRSGWID